MTHHKAEIIFSATFVECLLQGLTCTGPLPRAEQLAPGICFIHMLAPCPGVPVSE